MKPRRRVLVIARHFWPTTNDDTLRLFHWTQLLHQRGASVTVATPRWHPTWPRRIACDGVSVERIDSPPSNSLRLGSYARNLCQWLTGHGKFDLIYCDDADADAQTVLSRAPQLQSAPVVVRYAEAAGGSTAPARAVEVCRRTDLVLVGTQAAEQQLLAAGVQRHHLLRAVQVGGTCYDRMPDARRAARQVLGEANHDLFARSQDRVLVCPGELTQTWGVLDLIRELSPLIEEHRSLRVWILGDGRERPSIYHQLRQDGLHRLVAMPGIFTDLQEILQAADLCVIPARAAGLGWLLPTCIASSIPVVVADSPAVRPLLGDQAEQIAVPIDQPLALRNRISQWLRDPTPFAMAVSRLRKFVDTSGANSLDCDDLILLLQASAERHA